jgi:hypothetical protein
MFSRSAVPVWDLLWGNPGERNVRIPSPDKRSMLVAQAIAAHDGGGVQLSLRRGASTIWKEKFTPGVGIEAAWSPDSQSFYVTTSEAGRNGTYLTDVYLIDGKNLTKVEITPVIVVAFGHPNNCHWEEDPNVAGVKWLVPSKRLLVAAEIINHSNCDHYGTFHAYEVLVPNVSIVRRYGQIKAKRLFGSDLGWELKDAPDRCIRETCR